MGLAGTRTRRMQRLFSFYASPRQFFQLGFLLAYIFSPFRCAYIPFYRRPRRRFILIPFCNASPGTGRKSFPGQKLKGLKARRNDSTLSYVHYHFPFCSPYTSPARTKTYHSISPARPSLHHGRYYILFTLCRLLDLFYGAEATSFSYTTIYNV